MQPRIETLPEKKLIGKQIKMSYSNNRTIELWRSFMPRRKDIKNNTGSDLYSIELYEPGFFNSFNPEREFVKWAAVAVPDFSLVPGEMETLTLPSGLYAAFVYKGPASAASQLYQHILADWLPRSEYLLDNRPHFAVMGAKYKNEDPNSEEEIWIPVKLKVNRH
jgi:AraC family transcriptional regulator